MPASRHSPSAVRSSPLPVRRAVFENVRRGAVHRRKRIGVRAAPAGTGHRRRRVRARRAGALTAGIVLWLGIGSAAETTRSLIQERSDTVLDSLERQLRSRLEPVYQQARWIASLAADGSLELAEQDRLDAFMFGALAATPQVAAIGFLPAGRQGSGLVSGLPRRGARRPLGRSRRARVAAARRAGRDLLVAGPDLARYPERGGGPARLPPAAGRPVRGIARAGRTDRGALAGSGRARPAVHHPVRPPQGAAGARPSSAHPLGAGRYR